MKKLLTFVLTIAAISTVSDAAFDKINTYRNNFSDISDSSWYSESVKTSYELGFMNGKSEGEFVPDGNVTVAEGVTLASRIHAIYNGMDADSYSKKSSEIRFDFESLDNVSFNNADGEIKDGVLVLTAKPRVNNGKYDPGIFLDNLSFDARVYNKLVVRMKRDRLENPYTETHRSEALEVFFVNNDDIIMRQERCVTKTLKADEMSEWFEVEIDMTKSNLWKDNIRQIRFDPTNNNGIYYIDYIYFTQGEDKNAKWYHKYVDYAVDNGIMGEDTFRETDYARNITRAELCCLFAAALPEEFFSPINNIDAIPDVDKNSKYADILLALYKAGVVLGDSEGNFNPDSDIKRSETAAIINRVALPTNRVRGEIKTSADNVSYSNDYEFNDETFLDDLTFEAENVEIVNGALVLKAKERPASALKFDPKITDDFTDIDADMYPVMRIRMKADFSDIPTDTRCDIFFMHDDDETFTELDSYHPDLFEESYVDAFGWHVIELNMFKAKNWKGHIKALRFDPSNNGGTYTIDYIRFIRNNSREVISDEELAANYTERRIFPDITFENGFNVYRAGNRLTGERQDGIEGVWNYNDSDVAPSWDIGPWWTDYDFFENRDTSTDKYTLADKQGTKRLTYNPEEKSLTFTLNADKVYKGQPHNSGELWSHLIIIHDLYNDDYSKVPEERKPDLELKADKVYAEVDIKLNSCLDSENREGELLSNFLIFFYFAHKEIPDIHTYFGLRPVGFNNDSGRQYGWHNDSHSTMKIYSVPMMDLYESEEDSLWRKDGQLVTGQWKRIRVDITPHIENMIRLCNDENIYGRHVTMEDFWISGVNAGYEIRGNFRMEVEMKNLNLVCYDKKTNN